MFTFERWCRLQYDQYGSAVVTYIGVQYSEINIYWEFLLARQVASSSFKYILWIKVYTHYQTSCLIGVYVHVHAFCAHWQKPTELTSLNFTLGRKTCYSWKCAIMNPKGEKSNGRKHSGAKILLGRGSTWGENSSHAWAKILENKMIPIC